MGRTSSNRPRNTMRRARPALEGLEQRLVMSQAAGGLPVVPDSSPAGGEFFHNYQQFNYTTPSGTHVEILIVGRGSLEGTSVDSNGALHLLFSKTNSYTKIVSKVHGGTGQADLASIYSADLVNHDAETSLSGIGAPVLKTINLGNFNLIAGGTIDVTSGIDNLNLNSVGPGTQIQLRELPSTLTAGEATTTPASAGISNSFFTGGLQVQGLANINGEFLSAGTIVNVTVPGNPGPPPAPPGIVLKINHINGIIPSAPSLLNDNLLTNNMIFGLDATTGQVVRFDLTPVNYSPATASAPGAANMSQLTGTQDPNFTPITLPSGAGTPVAISVGRDGSQLVLLVSTGYEIYVYDATYGTLIGFFATFNPNATPPQPAFDATTLGSTDTLTVMGDTSANPADPSANHLQMIDVAASLADPNHMIHLLPSNKYPAIYTPPPGFTLLGGLTGLPGSNQVYPTVGATFNTFQPNTNELGLLTVSTSSASPNSDGSLQLTRQFSTVSKQAILSNGGYIPIVPSEMPPNPNPDLVGVPEGSVDSSLAINTIKPIEAAGKPTGQYTNQVSLLGPVSLSHRGTITLETTDPIIDLSESFRTDLTVTPTNQPALIDVQGNIQSLRGLTANGLVLNDTGYLNLIRTGKITNSTVLAQPIGHIQNPQTLQTQIYKNNVQYISTNNREFGARGGVTTLVSGLYQVGPLSLTNDVPPSSST